VSELESAIDKVNEQTSAFNTTFPTSVTFPNTPALEIQMRTMVEEFSMLVQLRKDTTWIDNLQRLVSPQSRITQALKIPNHDSCGIQPLNIKDNDCSNFECLPEAEDVLLNQPSVHPAGVSRTDILQEIENTGHSTTSSSPGIYIPGSVRSRIRPGRNQAHQSMDISQATLIDPSLSASSSQLAHRKLPTPELTDFDGRPPGMWLPKRHNSSFPDRDSITDHKVWMGISVPRSLGGSKLDPFDSLPMPMIRTNDIVLSQC
jgi:hypothetical protein